jgi:hypothetical protein
MPAPTGIQPTSTSWITAIRRIGQYPSNAKPLIVSAHPSHGQEKLC